MLSEAIARAENGTKAKLVGAPGYVAQQPEKLIIASSL